MGECGYLLYNIYISNILHTLLSSLIFSPSLFDANATGAIGADAQGIALLLIFLLSKQTFNN